MGRPNTVGHSAGQYLAECFWPGVTEADLADLDARARASARDQPVQYLGSLFVPLDEVVFCFFAGPSATAVREVATRAGIPFERVLETVRIGASSSAGIPSASSR